MGVLCLDSTGCALAAMRQIASVASLKDRAAHLCRAVAAFGFPVLILMLGGIFSLNANAQERVTRYCYERCFSSLYEAEAELRENAGSYGNLWRRRETHQYMDSASGPVFMIRYTVDDHSPSVLYPPGYVISGWDSRQGICSPAIDPYNATKCANEEEAVKGMLANFRATWPACPHVEEGFEEATHRIMRVFVELMATAQSRSRRLCRERRIESTTTPFGARVGVMVTSLLPCVTSRWRRFSILIAQRVSSRSMLTILRTSRADLAWIGLYCASRLCRRRQSMCTT